MPSKEVRKMERTSVKTRRIGPGQYASLNGQVRVTRGEDRMWTLFHLEEELKGGYKTSDAALTAAVQEHGFVLAELNTPPAKPKRERAAATATEEGEGRRTGSTGAAPAKPRGGRPAVKRSARRVA
jgi:hypothetical protein